MGVLTLWLVSLIVFGATQALPGDAAKAILGQEATPAKVQALRSELGLDKSKPQQYVDWLSGVLRGDMGTSLAQRNTSVTTLLQTRVFNSAVLVLVAAGLSIPVSLLIGALSALWRDSPFDMCISIGTLALAALPEFVLGIALIMIFATSLLDVLPAVSRLDSSLSIWSQWQMLILPALTLLLAVGPYIVRILRASMIEVLESEYVAMARLKGLRTRIILTRHALPNAVIPAIQGTALQLAWLAGGIVVVEYLFGFPGIGGALVEAIASRDLPVIQALSLLIASVYVLTNLGADILTILVSPRLRAGLR